MRMLLVDDDSRLRQVLKRLLNSQHHAIREAADGEEALGLLREEPADLIFTDWQMPRMDGLAMTRALRGAGNRTPIIMFSGHGDPHTIVTAIQAGVNNYIPKPINAEVLFEKIQQTMGSLAA